jgi:sugar phosphate permease
MNIGLALTVLYLVSAGIAPVLGYWLDKGSIRNIMALGGLFMASGLALLGSATALWQMMVVVVFLISLGFSMLGHLPSSKVVTNWFLRKRGRALGFSAVGTSLGGFVLPPVTAVLILEVGWRGSLWALGAGVALLIIPSVWLVIVNRPEDVGQTPDGPRLAEPDGSGDAEAGEAEGMVAEAAHVSIGAVLRNRNFWGIGICVAFLVVSGTMFLVHWPAHAKEVGIEATTAALILSCYAGAGMVGKVIYGMLADRFDKRLLFWSVAAVKGGAFVAFLSTPNVSMLLVVTIFFGLGAGGTMPVWNSLVGHCFGRQAFGRVMGLMGMILLPFLMFPAPLGGYIFDQTGSYVLVFQLTTASFPLAALAAGLIRVPEREPGT